MPVPHPLSKFLHMRFDRPDLYYCLEAQRMMRDSYQRLGPRAFFDLPALQVTHSEVHHAHR